MTLDVLHLDNHLLVVAKPAGLLAQADETGDIDLLTLGKAYLKDHFNKPGNVFLGLVHRLDRPVSGVMVLARTSKAAARLTSQFKQRTVSKRYIALVEGSLKGQGVYEDHMVKDGRQARIVGKNHPKAKHARLAWSCIATNGTHSLMDIELFTGRAHQIRLQFASRKHPLIGDLRYGANGEFDGRNLALHAYHLALSHPTQKTPLQWRLMPPASWSAYFAEETAALIKNE